MSLYHYRKDDRNNNIGGKAIHLWHGPGGTTKIGVCWQSDEGSLIELAVFCFFLRWYFRVRSKSTMKRIEEFYKEGHRIISEINWGKYGLRS
jgi:hypothetical protein